MTCWSIVVPVKRLAAAKSRLRADTTAQRQEIALAMALDTVEAALACELVAQVVAVCDDPVAAPRLRELGAVVVADEPAAGLNPALAHGAAVAARLAPDCGVAALSADLPALTARELASALRASATHRQAVVADASGEGTTLLTSRSGDPLAPAYGEASLQRHAASGAVVLDLEGVDGLRQDVDTRDDLALAERIGLGRRTAAVLHAHR